MSNYLTDKSRIRESFRKEKPENGKETSKTPYFAKRYQDFFEGYYVEQNTDPLTGRKSVKRTYVGDVYSPSVSVGSWYMHKVIYALLFTLSVVLFAISATKNVSANTQWYAVIAQVLAVAAIILTGYTLVKYVAAPFEMTVSIQRKLKLPLKVKTLIGCGAFMTCAVVSLVMGIINREITDLPAAETFAWIANYIIAGASFLLISQMEERMQYVVVRSGSYTGNLQEKGSI